ncbi:MAG: hydrolase, partial [Candidatus Saccharibacteria bacterium]|nr:hydrolase [Candidatus Saccharibacteria bacterium]
MRTIQRDIVGAFIFSSDNMILLGKTAAYEGLWVVPGGGIDDGETRLQALERELLEETGLDIAEARVEEIEGALTGKSEKVLRDTEERVVVDMRFYNFKLSFPKKASEIKVEARDDFKDARWLSVSEIASIKLSPPTAT